LAREDVSGWLTEDEQMLTFFARDSAIIALGDWRRASEKLGFSDTLIAVQQV
jgi:hypothetical protein